MSQQWQEALQLGRSCWQLPLLLASAAACAGAMLELRVEPPREHEYRAEPFYSG